MSLKIVICLNILMQIKHKVDMKVTQSCPALWDPMIYTVHQILQARVLEWVAFPFSRGSSQPRVRTQLSLYCKLILYQLNHKGSSRMQEGVAYPFSSRSSRHRNWTRVSCIAGGFFTNRAIREALKHGSSWFTKYVWHIL